jgi:YbgC/YbaW family acyl-CoA thioester hydrolase
MTSEFDNEPTGTWSGYVHRVRWSEVDPQNIVFNSRYLEFFDAAMTEYYRVIGYPPMEIGSTDFDPVVVKAEINYRSSAVMDDVLRITVACTRMGTSSLDLGFEIFRETTQELLVLATITYVNLDQSTRKPAPVPVEVRTAMGF